MHHHTSMPNAFNPANISDEMRDKALKCTTEMLREFVKIRNTLELPVDQLPIVIETYGEVVLALVTEAARAEIAKHTQRLPLTLRSEDRAYEPMKIRPGKSFDVVVRPQIGEFRPEDLAIHGDRSRWIVHDFKICNRSQFVSKRGPAPGTEFGPGGILEHLKLDTVPLAGDLVLCVEYVGPEVEGEVFEATMVGTAPTSF